MKLRSYLIIFITAMAGTFFLASCLNEENKIPPNCYDGIFNNGENPELYVDRLTGQVMLDCGGPCAGNITYDYTLVLGGPATGPHECTFVFADGTVILAGLFAGPPNYFTIGTRPGLLSTYSCNPGAQYEDVVVSTNACS